MRNSGNLIGDGGSCAGVNGVHPLTQFGNDCAAARRFHEIKRSIDGISQQMLTRTLRGLERDGVVERTILASSPPQVEYALTNLGRSLSKPVVALGRWACEHIEDVNEAQKLFDERQRHAG